MKKITTILLITAIAIAAITCKKTPEIPTGNKIEIGETTIDSIAYYTTSVSTIITATGGNEITQHGHCWSTEKGPSIENLITMLGKLAQPKEYTSELTNLTANTVYYIRSYITYKNGTIYGAEVSVKTLATRAPIVTTNEVTNITISTATCGGTNDDGGLTITSRGVCWNTTDNPTLENNIGITDNGTGVGAYISQLTNLSVNTTYYVTAYATNEKGTSYGEIKSFMITNNFMDPRDGQTYETVVIGSQTWFAENLNYQTANSWWYNNSSTNGDVYGRLYTWEAATNACPAGWHLPTDDEWKILEGNTDTQYGVGDPEWDVTYNRGFDAGKRLKTTTGWNQNTGTNAVSFSALPGGFFATNVNFYTLGLDGNWWSTTEISSTNAWGRQLNHTFDGVVRFPNDKADGFSVRCIKD